MNCNGFWNRSARLWRFWVLTLMSEKENKNKKRVHWVDMTKFSLLLMRIKLTFRTGFIDFFESKLKINIEFNCPTMAFELIHRYRTKITPLLKQWNEGMFALQMCLFDSKSIFYQLPNERKNTLTNHTAFLT